MNRDRNDSRSGLQETLERAYAGQPTLFDGGQLTCQSGARLVTLNFARLALEKHCQIEGDELILWLLTVDGVNAIKSVFPSNSKVFNYNPQNNHTRLEKLLNIHMGNPSLAAAIVDNGKDSLGCLKFQYHSLRGQMFLTFNSQVTKPGVVKIYLSNSLDETAEFIASNLGPPESGPNEEVFFYVLIERTTPSISGSAMPEQHTEASNPTIKTFEGSDYLTHTGSELAVPPDLGEDFVRSQYVALAMLVADEEEELVNILQLSLVEGESSASQNLDAPQVHGGLGVPAACSSNSADLQCGVCMDSYREEFVTRLSDCRHMFCEDCLKGTIKANLRSRKFPIFCPACTADGGTEEPSIVDEFIIRKLGITSQEIEIFEEMQNSSVSIKMQELGLGR
ncbi:hypothetical protein C0995_012023 [Termitomyces sp. Mi166|nr:hypothetical protein C0995_012023 [Termitomyces sp. Mi166\